MPETTIELLPPAGSAEAEAEEVTESAPTEAMEQPDQEPAAAPKRRGRPAGAKNKPKPPTTVVSTPPLAPVAPAVAEPPEIELPPPAPKAKAKPKPKPKVSVVLPVVAQPKTLPQAKSKMKIGLKKYPITGF